MYADGHSECAEAARPRPQNDAGDEVDYAGSHDLPEHRFLTGVEESRVRRLEFFLPGSNLPDVAHPFCIR